MKLPQPVFDTALLVDDGLNYIEGQKKLMLSGGYVNRVELATSCEDALLLIPQVKPEIIFLDVEIKNKMNGSVCQAHITKNYPHIKVIANTFYEDCLTLTRMLMAGSIGFVTKNLSPDEMLAAMQHAKEGKYYISNLMREQITPELAKKYNLPASGTAFNLRERQLEVLALMLQGETMKQIADILNISYYTVEDHRKKIYKETNTNSLKELLQLNNVKNIVSKWWGVRKGW